MVIGVGRSKFLKLHDQYDKEGVFLPHENALQELVGEDKDIDPCNEYTYSFMLKEIGTTKLIVKLCNELLRERKHDT